MAVASVALAMLLTVSMLTAVQGMGPATGTLTGMVTDADTEEPIEGAVVTLEYHGLTRTDLTDAKGTYEFKGVPLCYCLKDVTASAKGYEAQTQAVGVGAYTVVDFALVPDDGGGDETTAVLTGTVTDADTGEPIEDARMTLTYHDVSRKGLTDADGVYRFEDVPACFCLKNISASKDGYIDQSKEVGVSGVTVVDFALMIEELEPDTGTIVGTVTDLNNGEPLEGVLIELTYHDVLRTAYTDADGRYSFDQVPECRCLKTVKASLEHFRPESQDVSVHGVTVADFALMIEEQEPPIGSLTGTVTDAATGEPIEGALVTLEYHDVSRTAVTDADGWFEFAEVDICRCMKALFASKDGYETWSEMVAIDGDTVMDIALEPVDGPDDPNTGTLKGTVTDAATGEPIEGATVTLEYHGIVRIATTDPEGQYAFTGVPICFCLKDVSVTSDGYEGASESVGVGELTVLDFALRPVAGPDGTVDPVDGKIGGRIDSGGSSAITAVQGVAVIGLVVAFVAALLIAVSVRNARD
jgi:CBS domain-containing protein